MKFSPRRLRVRGRAAALGASAAALLLLLAAAAPHAAHAQIGFSRGVGREMLKDIKRDIRENYYDPSFRGKDLDAHFKAAEEMIARAETTEQVYAVVAQALMDFGDSHLYFVPPMWSASADYGWRMRMVGDRCFVTAVRPGSDAEAKGLRPGDLVHSVDGFAPERATLWKMDYYYNALAPKPGMVVAVRGADGKARQLQIAAKITKGKVVQDVGGQDWYRRQIEADKDAELYKGRMAEFGEDLLVWKMPTFVLDAEKVNEAMDRARGHKTLVLDLRGNGGGRLDTLLALLGNFFDRDVKVGDVKTRKEARPLVAKTRGGGVFKGNLVVLLDSESGSASEVFACAVQLEKRGTVVGDRSAGAVMASRFYTHRIGQGEFVLYGVSVTVQDIIMSDGKSLEHAGVIPDELLLPAGADLAAGADPVLARAASLAGVKLDPARAGALFPALWRK
ncbi:MAG TPA: S41 family peptidase [Pyrinomonadaceae bacterium]|jgi:carboxyl-terminal processing protease